MDFPLSLILPLVVWLFKRQKDFNYQEKTEKDKEERKNIAKYKNNKQVKYFAGITLLIFFPILFSLTGCQRLTDVEEKTISYPCTLIIPLMKKMLISFG